MISMLDIDGFRIDKGAQVTVDAQADFGQFIRQCARRIGKTNFLIAGEITYGDTLGSIYLGRGRQPNQVPENATQVIKAATASENGFFLREKGKNALDAAVFHYSIYRSLTSFLGMEGSLAVENDLPINFVDAWNIMLRTNDFVNANTGEFDPRHMYGVSNQDVFRWPAIKDGTQKMLLGLYITTLHIPGIPLLLWGEEQAFYILDNTADNYIYGRQAMSSSPAWQIHGCYGLGSSQYDNFPVDSALSGCHDDLVSLDHRDPAHPVRNIIKSMFQARQSYPILNDGYLLQTLSNQSQDYFLSGPDNAATELGMWSVMRHQYPNLQKLDETIGPVWLVYQNENHAVNYSFNCSSNDSALISPYSQWTTVKNILAPYDELELEAGPVRLGINGSEEFNGCAPKLKLGPFDFKAYVPKDRWIAPLPVITKFLPGHDARILSTIEVNQTETIDIELQFSAAMDCNQITSNLVISSTAANNISALVNTSTISCAVLQTPDSASYVGEIPSIWTWKASLVNVSNGIHSITVQNATTSEGTSFTNSKDRFLFRIGQEDNPMVFPRLANYSREVLYRDPISEDLYVSHKACGKFPISPNTAWYFICLGDTYSMTSLGRSTLAGRYLDSPFYFSEVMLIPKSCGLGAEKWRYSLNWASSWSDWKDYEAGNISLVAQPWSGTNRQRWAGEHVILQYWSRLTGSSDYLQHSDLITSERPYQQTRRYPHLFAEGPFNQFGFDQGLKNDFYLDPGDNLWKFHLMTEWPSTLQVNVWGTNPDGQPDQTMVFGDVRNNSVLDRMLPDSLGETQINFTFPPAPFLAYRLEVNDGMLSFQRVPVGSRVTQTVVFALLWAIPAATGILSVWIYMVAFYS
jgi:alpha-1,3-glucan synthase